MVGPLYTLKGEKNETRLSLYLGSEVRHTCIILMLYLSLSLVAEHVFPHVLYLEIIGD